MSKPKLKAVETPAAEVQEIQVVSPTPAQVPYLWPKIEEGIREAVGQCRGEISAETVYEDLVSGGRGLWLWIQDGELVAFVVFNVVRLPLRLELLLYLVWSKAGSGVDVLEEGLPFVEDYARKAGCRAVQFQSRLTETRSGKDAAERFKGLGFEPGSREYVKEL